MWIEFMKDFSDRCGFVIPAGNPAINDAEKSLGVVFHADLKAALLESNGISAEYGIRLLWNIDRIKSDNIAFRTNPDFKDLYMPFDNLLFFGDAGNGNQFAYSIQNGRIRNNDIFVWNHENDSRTWTAPDLKTFFEWCLTHKIEV